MQRKPYLETEKKGGQITKGMKIRSVKRSGTK